MWTKIGSIQSFANFIFIFKDQSYSDAEHTQGVELELMQALAREARLKVRLQELVMTLEQVTKNAEARLLEGRDIVQDLNHTNR